MPKAKGLNINAAPFEPGATPTATVNALPSLNYSYVHGQGPVSNSTIPGNPSAPGIYFRPPDPYNGPMCQYASPDQQPTPVPSMPVFYYGPNYSVLPQPPPYQWPVGPPPPPPSRQPSSSAASTHRRHANHGYRAGRSNSSSVLKVLTSTSSAAPATVVSKATTTTAVSSSISQQSTGSVTRVCNANSTTNSSTNAAAVVKPRNAEPQLQLGSAEDFPALSSGAGGGGGGVSVAGSQPAGVKFGPAQLQKNLDANSDSAQSRTLSYSAAIRQPRPPPAAAPQLQPSNSFSTSTPSQPPAGKVSTDAKEHSEPAEANSNKIQLKQKKSRSNRRSKKKRSKKKSGLQDKQQLGADDAGLGEAEQQPEFQLEQEEFPSLQAGRPAPSVTAGSALPPTSTVQQPEACGTSGSKSQPQPQSVGRRQQLNRAARQSLLLSSSLLVVNKAIAAVHQRPAAGKSSGAASSGVGHSSSGAPVRVGKQRERPKAKKKSLTKKIILMERQARRKAATAATAAADAEKEAADKESTDAENCDAPSPSSVCQSPEAVEPPPPPPPPAPQSKSIHSRRFREYCDQLLMKSVQELSVKVLRDLAFYQARARARDPAKAKQKRRLVMGLREARKHIGLNRIRLVFISPDLERVQAPGGLDDSVNQLINLCQQRSVPYVFGLKRREMGRVLRKTVPVSVVAVFDYQGCEANVNALLELVHKARADYETLSRMALECARVDDHSVAKDAIVVANEAATEVAEESVTNQQQQIRPSASHSRNPSDTSNPISEPLSELDSSAPAAAAVASAAPNSQLYGFHSRQSSLGVVVVAQAIDENESGAANDAANSSTAGDKVAKWLSNGTELGDA
ncbi:hypothetical protein BOX15_Mlig007671g1 [Macrostomum lignano]|uniref:Ribosomal protein eL8/eL30/eS12/Gadd45 domain-containing protein n=2 Tax=Macrostomum lignano TaxID=282301 RepID=A0A267DXC2_9PLAT|nr:hypothetical protein BOX15_Mlig007671g1 [Macrostomum lignano]